MSLRLCARSSSRLASLGHDTCTPWLSTTRLDEATPVLRACITNYRTEATDVVALVQALNEARSRIDRDAANQS